MESLRVLVIEDDDDIAELLTLQLEFGLGATVVRARDGYVGLALLRSEHFDAAVLDLVLPGASGLTILERLRRHEVLTPVVVLTGYGDRASEVLRLGAFAVLSKPYVRSQLLDTVRDAAGAFVAA